MRKLLYIALVACLAYPAMTMADEPKPEVKKPAVTIGDYSKALKHYTKMVNGFSEDAIYVGLVFELPLDEGKKELKFAELSSLEKRIYQMTVAERLTVGMNALEEAWKVDLKKLTTPDPIEGEVGDEVPPAPGANEEVKKDKPLPDDPNDMKPTKETVAVYVGLLHELRKKMAVKFEGFATKVLDEHKDDIKQTERDHYLKMIHDYHDKHKLVERQDAK